MNRAQSYNFDQIREQINKELLDEKMPERLYESTNGISRIINAIVKTKGEDWAAQVLNNEGNPLLTPEEQVQFTQVFEPFVETIIEFFNPEAKSTGGVYKPDVSKLSGMSKSFLKTKAAQATNSYPIPPFDPTTMVGVDDLYGKIYHKIGSVNSSMNDYASKYGILKFEKEHDLEEDVRVIPQPAAMGISSGVFGLLKIPPQVTLQVLSKIKVPFRTIIFVIYLALDIARLAVGLTGQALGRKILSVVLAIVELLRGDWKKAILTMVGYFGMMPMLYGELFKILLTMFRMLAPQIQQNIVFGSLDAVKSFIVGLLLSIFQVTAPEQVRLPLIGVLEKIAQHKAKMDGTLESIGLSARPDYLSPTWTDFNNIQAVMSDEAYICSCEFKQLVDVVGKSAIIRIVLQILRIPVSQEMIEYKCGKEPCKDFVTTVVAEAKEDTEQEAKYNAPFSMSDLKADVDLNPFTSITAPVPNEGEEAPKEEGEATKEEEEATKEEGEAPKEEEEATKEEGEATKEEGEEAPKEEKEEAPKEEEEAPKEEREATKEEEEATKEEKEAPKEEREATKEEEEATKEEKEAPKEEKEAPKEEKEAPKKEKEATKEKKKEEKSKNETKSVGGRVLHSRRKFNA